MVVLRQCCCGVSLKKGTLAICCWILAQEFMTFIALIATPDTQPAKSLGIGSNSVRYFQIWSTVFNIIVVAIALYGVQKLRAPFLIPYLAYRTMNLIFSIFTLFSVRDISNSLNETLENSFNNERDQTFDTLPVVVIFTLVNIAIDLYFLLVVYSYYQILMVNTTMVAVSLPIISCSVSNSDTANMYAQPALNPYLFDTKYPYQHNEPYLGLQYYGSAAGSHPSLSNSLMPPPYRP